MQSENASGTLYTNEVRQFLHTRDWPKGLIWEVVEFDMYLRIRFYRENINALSGDAKLHMVTVLNETLRSLHDKGVPAYTWVVAGNGK